MNLDKVLERCKIWWIYTFPKSKYKNNLPWSVETADLRGQLWKGLDVVWERRLFGAHQVSLSANLWCNLESHRVRNQYTLWSSPNFSKDPQFLSWVLLSDFLTHVDAISVLRLWSRQTTSVQITLGVKLAFIAEQRNLVVGLMRIWMGIYRHLYNTRCWICHWCRKNGWRIH